MKYYTFTLKFGAKNKEKFVTHDIFKVIPFSPPLCRNLFAIFLDSRLKKLWFCWWVDLETSGFHVPSDRKARFRSYYLALINRAGGPGVEESWPRSQVQTGRTQGGLYTRPRSRFSHTDRLSSVNKMFIIWKKQEQFNSLNVTGLY